MDPRVTGAAPIHDITARMDENCQKLSAPAKMNIAATNCQLFCRRKVSGVFSIIMDVTAQSTDMNGGLWRRVEASITRGNNAMTNQRDSGMTIALERIQYWEIELIDGGPADTRETRTLLEN